jgi:hypothetical protein
MRVRPKQKCDSTHISNDDHTLGKDQFRHHPLPLRQPKTPTDHSLLPLLCVCTRTYSLVELLSTQIRPLALRSKPFLRGY